MDEFIKSLERLKDYVEARDYSGHDLYDGLKLTRSPRVLKNKFLNTAITQFFKLSPLNVRPLARIAPTAMPKAAGLFLDGYSRLAAAPRFAGDKDTHLERAAVLLDGLAKSAVPGYSGYCWNFGFPYKFLFQAPTVVITAIIARGLFSYFGQTRDQRAKEMLLGIRDFILRDLKITETRDGACFSYTPIEKDCCYNANMLAAETLARIHHVAPGDELVAHIEKAVDFTLAHQQDDGRWNYSIDIATGGERPQVDFHQGYILDSLAAVIELAGLDSPRYTGALKKGIAFYRHRQFFETGRSLWRLPREWPVDIHNQAQGIITFTGLCELDPGYLDFARTVARWTIDHMQDGSGYFYFRKGRFFTNKISYMRWSNAWMFLALARLIAREGEDHR